MALHYLSCDKARQNSPGLYLQDTSFPDGEAGAEGAESSER
jgi:hypothetical protein